MIRTGSIGRLSVFILIALISGLVGGFAVGTRPTSAPGSSGSTTSVFVTTTYSAQGQAGLVEYCFSPGGSCSSLVVKWINRANSSVHVLIYSFTLTDITNALIAAKNRGIQVKIVMERSNANERGSEYQALKNAGVDIRLDTSSGLLHDKVAIIDGRIILTGSFNYSASANLDNNENLVVIDNTAWSSAFETQFQRIYNLATS